MARIPDSATAGYAFVCGIADANALPGLAIFTLLMMAVNAMFMLFSPRLWFRLPGWIRANGGLRMRSTVPVWAPCKFEFWVAWSWLC